MVYKFFDPWSEMIITFISLAVSKLQAMDEVQLLKHMREKEKLYETTPTSWTLKVNQAKRWRAYTNLLMKTTIWSRRWPQADRNNLVQQASSALDIGTANQRQFQQWLPHIQCHGTFIPPKIASRDTFRPPQRRNRPIAPTIQVAAAIPTEIKLQPPSRATSLV
jgi:hypothetical protein